MNKIGIITHLKPLDDPRHLHKIARSLVKTKNYEVNIIGYGQKKYHEANNIRLIPINWASNAGVRRFLLPWWSVFKSVKLGCNIVIINHPELLIPATIAKSIYKFKLVYDIQENYAFNIKYQNNHSFLSKHILARIVNFTQSICASWVNHFLLAEKIYVEQLSFIGTKFTVIENKAIEVLTQSENTKTTDGIALLFTGNISKNSGADRAIILAKKLYEQNKYITLLVVGHCPSKDFNDYLHAITKDAPYIALQLHSEPVAYEEIVNAISKSDIGILSYRENRSNIGKIPTKYFEYNAARFPYLVEKGASWTTLPSEISISIDFENTSYAEILHAYQVKSKPQSNPLDAFLWTTEEPKLLSALNSL